MRVLVALLLLMPLPAMGAGWGHYVNPRYGYAIDVPPGFVAQGEADDGGGQSFKTPTATLSAFGQYIIIDGGKFDDEVRQDQGYAKQNGWSITYSVSTPSYASYSSVKGGRVTYSRMIPLCGDAFAEFDLEYSKADIQKFNPIIDRLVASLKPTDGSVACPPKK